MTGASRVDRRGAHGVLAVGRSRPRTPRRPPSRCSCRRDQVDGGHAARHRRARRARRVRPGPGVEGRRTTSYTRIAASRRSSSSGRRHVAEHPTRGPAAGIRRAAGSEPGAPQTASQRCRSFSTGSSPASASRTWISSRLSRRCRPRRGERVERALPVEVHQADPAARPRRRTARACTAARTRTPAPPARCSRRAGRCRCRRRRRGRAVDRQPGEAEVVGASPARRARPASASSSSTTSAWVWRNAAPSAARKQTEPVPAGMQPDAGLQRDRRARARGTASRGWPAWRVPRPRTRVPEPHQRLGRGRARPGSGPAARAAAPAAGGSR